MDAKHVSTLFAEANPVPDVDEVRRELGTSAVDLATLESRSRAMDTKHLNQLEPAAPPKHRRRPALVFATALVLVIVTIGGGVLLLQGDTPPAIDEPTTTVAPPETTEVPVTTTAAPVTTITEAAPAPAPPLGEGWEIFIVPDGAQPTQAAGYVEGIGWIAVGGPHIMISPSGTDWIESDAEGMVLNEAGFLTGVIAGGPGALAYGRTCEGGGDFGHEPFPCPQEPALYGSADGLTWERINSDAFHGCVDNEAMECYAGIDALAVAADGSLIASGSDPTRRGGETDPYVVESAVWTSDDGYAWERHEVDLGAFAPEGWYALSESLQHIVHAGDRWLALLPIERYVADIDDWEGTTLLVESTDGSEWTVVETDAFTVEASPDVLVDGSKGLLALGGQTAWLSEAGNEWTQSTIPGDYWYDRAIALESGFLTYTREGPTAFAFSPDGMTWMTVEAGEDLSNFRLNDFAGVEAGGEVILVGVGYHGDPGVDQESYGAAIATWTEALTG